MVKIQSIDSIAGNYYKKHKSKNPAVQYILKKFYSDLDKLIGDTYFHSILDVGCGEGVTTKYLKKKYIVSDVHFLDISKKIISDNFDISESMLSLCADSHFLPYKDDSFDFVISTEVLEHLESPKESLLELRRVSKKACVVSVPNEPFWRIANICRMSYLLHLGNTPGHINHFTILSLPKLLKSMFSDVKISYSTLWIIAYCIK